MGPQVIGPRLDGGRGVLGPCGRRKGFYALPHFIPVILLYFYPCGIMCSFCRWRGGSRCVRWNDFDQRASIVWTQVQPITIKAHAYWWTVDHISDIRRPQFNRAFDDSWSDTWLDKETMMKIEQPKSKRSGIRIVGSWPTDCAPSQPSKSPLANQMDYIFCDNFL